MALIVVQGATVVFTELFEIEVLGMKTEQLKLVRSLSPLKPC